MGETEGDGEIMPTITYDRKDLMNLIGKISHEQLEEAIHLLKPELETLTEHEITLKMTPDRPDMFGVEGLARSIKQFLGIQMGMKKYTLSSARLQIKDSHVPNRPYLAAAVVKNVPMSDAFIKSMMNIQEVLAESIGRKRKKVAIGIHDFDKIVSNITYSEVNPNETIIPLGMKEEMTLKEVLEKIPKGKEYGHIVSNNQKFPVYSDTKGIFSFPPIINSERTRVTESTKNLLVELTGTDQEAVLQTLNIIVTNFADRGCEIEGVKIFSGDKYYITPVISPVFVEITLEEINKLLGLELQKMDVTAVLNRMGYDVAENRNALRIFIPAYRTDILHKMDVMEDIAIGYGFNNLIPQLPNIATVGRSHTTEKLSSKIRQLMVGFGLQEIIQPILTNNKNLFAMMNVEKEKIIELENPVSEEYTCLRSWLLPSLIEVLSKNKHVEYPQNIFEVGDVVVFDSSEETMSKTVRKLAGITCHSKSSYTEIKGIVETLLRQAGVKYSFKENSNGTFIEGRRADIISNDKSIGMIGEISPVVLGNWKLEMPCAAFEINLDLI